MMKKKSLLLITFCGVLFLAGVVGLVTLVAGGLYFSTSGAVASADGFLKDISEGQLAAARESMSLEFSNSITDDELQSFATENQLDQFQSSTWSQQAIKNNHGRLAGTITTRSGVAIPMQLQLVFEQGQWKVQELQSVEPSGSRSDTKALAANLTLNDGIDPAGPTPTMPSGKPLEVRKAANGSRPNAEPFQSPIPDRFLEESILSVNDIPSRVNARQLVKRWTKEFRDSFRQGDFGEFHEQTTLDFQQRVPLDRFSRVFNKLVEQEIDLDWTQTATPTLSQPPMLDADGILRLVGSFPGENRLEFNYALKRDSDDWKLHDINLTVNPMSEKLFLPELRQLKALVQEQTTRFAKSVVNQDFSKFHAAASEKFRQQVPLKRFSTIFKSFIQNNVSLKWIGAAEPEFDVLPTINAKGLVSLKGHYPVEPKVSFEYGLVQEDLDWKIISVNLSVAPTE